MTPECEKALGFWTIGIQYLNLVQAVSNEIYQQGNTHILISDQPISTKQYTEETKWSDHKLIIPTLFNFYHGVEVLLKGFLSIKKPSVKLSHKLTILYEDYNKEYGENNVGILLKKYLSPEQLPPILSEFLKESNINIDDYYQSLKYPENTKGLPFKHYPLKYKDEEGIPFFYDLCNDIEELRKAIISLGRQVCRDI